MNTIRLIAIALPVMLLMACGGGGGGSAAAPTTPTSSTGGGPTMPTGPQALPSALISNVGNARMNFTGATPTTATSTEIQAAFQMEAMDADTLIDSDAFVRSMSFSNGADISAGGGITLGDFTFTSSLENIRMGIADRFNLERVSSQYSPVMDYRGVTFAQYQAAGRTDDNDVLEYQSYGGWLTNSAFSVDMLTIDHGSREDSILIGVSYGDATGSRPTSGSTNWNGVFIGIEKSNGNVIQGNAGIIVDFADSTADVFFDNAANLNQVEIALAMLWAGIPINTDGTFSSTTNGDIDGAFYGTGHTEVGGTFNRGGFIGAFGGTKE